MTELPLRAEPECPHFSRRMDLTGDEPVMRCMTCDDAQPVSAGPGPAVIRRPGDPDFDGGGLPIPYLENVSGAKYWDAHEISGPPLTADEMATVQEYLHSKYGI